jgi:mersacidin/lichenicidin family type 2 lantibiotic
MSVAEMVRAWKDEDFRLSLSEDAVPKHPSGLVESELYVGIGDSLNTCEFFSSCGRICSN